MRQKTGLRFIRQFHMEFPHDPAISFTSIDPGEVMEKAMATHSSTLAWRIPGTGEPGRLPSMGSHRVGHDLAAAAAEVDTCSNQNLHTHIQSGSSMETKQHLLRSQWVGLPWWSRGGEAVRQCRACFRCSVAKVPNFL